MLSLTNLSTDDAGYYVLFSADELLVFGLTSHHTAWVLFVIKPFHTPYEYYLPIFIE